MHRIRALAWFLLGAVIVAAAADLAAERGAIANLVGSTRALTSSILALDVAINDTGGNHFDDFATDTTLQSIDTSNTAIANSLNNLAPAADSTVAISENTAATHELIPLASGEVIDVAYGYIVAEGTVDVTFVYGTGTDCATGTTNLSGPIALATTIQPSVPLSGLFVPAGKALCMTLSGAVQVNGYAGYAQYTP